MKLSTVRRLTYMLLALICVMLVLVWYLDVYELVYSAVTLVVLVGIVNCLFWKCPHCGKNLGRLEKQNHCHNCGKELVM
ncbi:MAG: hypothetical protein IKU62_00200 [Ruminiclostridium sp.]|nr:hypothetical protein [Ruminiclostridium sp.]